MFPHKVVRSKFVFSQANPQRSFTNRLRKFAPHQISFSPEGGFGQFPIPAKSTKDSHKEVRTPTPQWCSPPVFMTPRKGRGESPTCFAFRIQELPSPRVQITFPLLWGKVIWTVSVLKISQVMTMPFQVSQGGGLLIWPKHRGPPYIPRFWVSFCSGGNEPVSCTDVHFYARVRELVSPPTVSSMLGLSILSDSQKTPQILICFFPRVSWLFFCWFSLFCPRFYEGYSGDNGLTWFEVNCCLSKHNPMLPCFNQRASGINQVSYPKSPNLRSPELQT